MDTRYSLNSSSSGRGRRGRRSSWGFNSRQDEGSGLLAIDYATYGDVALVGRTSSRDARPRESVEIGDVC
jgi:hypothetical protein